MEMGGESMTIPALNGYFSVSATVAGSLIGLLYIAITLRYDYILGPRAPRRNRALAASAFAALANALAISVWALIPGVDLGYPAGIMAVVCLYTMFQTHFRTVGQRQAANHLFILSMGVYLFELGLSVLLIWHPRHIQLVYVLSYIVFAALVAALIRSWELLQAEASPDSGDNDTDTSARGM